MDEFKPKINLHLKSEVEEKADFITEYILQQAFEDLAAELNQFPLSSLGVLMEWDDSEEDTVVTTPGFPTTLNFIKDYLIAFS